MAARVFFMNFYTKEAYTFSLPAFWNKRHARVGGNFRPAPLFLYGLWALDFFYVPALSLTKSVRGRLQTIFQKNVIVV